MRYWLAALLLLPASWRVYGTPRAWLGALASGPAVFFSAVVKDAPLRVRRSPSLWRNVLVYWPMKAGMDLIHGGSVRALLGKARRLLQRGRGDSRLNPPVQDAAGDCGPPPVPATAVCAMIRQPGIRVVSFDIFDTLLVRPALKPKDIFHVVAARVDSLYGVDFIKMRWNAEEETGLAHAAIHDIYAHIQRKHGLDDATATALLDEELQCEAALLAPRADMRPCYDEAVRLGKRVIAVSDMYIPAEILRTFLQRHGFDHICELYVSCDHGRRKDDGTLYDLVLASEGVHPSEMLHIGDNYRADCHAALTRRITALHCPSPLMRSLNADPHLAAVLDAAARRDPCWSLLWGFGLHRLCGNGEGQPLADAGDAGRLAALTLAPLLTGHALWLVNDESLRAYSHIHFASRDGYLPHRVYSIIGRHMPCPPAVYFHAGRRLYYPLLHDSFFEYAAALEPAGDNLYTLRDFLQAHFGSSELYARMDAALTDQKKALPFFTHKKRCLRILRHFEHAIDAVMEEKRTRARRYYASVFPRQDSRHLVFDLGYSGSVGRALAAATGKPVDKLYFWATSANRRHDKAQGSSTRTFMRGRPSLPYNLFFEEVFSPCTGGAVDIDAAGQPVLESLPADPAFRADMDAMHHACLSYAEAFCARFGAYAALVRPASGDAAVDVCRYLLAESPFRNMRLLKNITFPDPLHHAGAPSLEQKMERFLPQKTVFSGSGFADPRHVLVPDPCLADAPSLGMHVHLHNVALSDEMLRYLREFPVPLDIYVTITDRDAQRTVENLFSAACIPHAQEVRVLPVPNRGRDIAPWVLDMRPCQARYDLFCHVHAKESAHFDFGEQWRRYLFDNLLTPAAVGGILALFRQRPRLGCLFPPVFPPLADFMNARGIPPSGLDGEWGMARDLLRRMGLRHRLCRSDLFFPVGSMLWYRPAALRQLFTVDLRREEFAAEPIGVAGTLAHAIERLPALLATGNAYQAASFVAEPVRRHIS